MIPAAIREELDMAPGTEVLVRVEDGCLILETRRNVMRRLQSRFDHLPQGLSLADELIADRRREAAAEEATAATTEETTRG